MANVAPVPVGEPKQPDDHHVPTQMMAWSLDSHSLWRDGRPCYCFGCSLGPCHAEGPVKKKSWRERECHTTRVMLSCWSLRLALVSHLPMGSVNPSPLVAVTQPHIRRHAAVSRHLCSHSVFRLICLSGLLVFNWSLCSEPMRRASNRRSRI